MTYSINGYPIDVVRQYRPKYTSKTTDHPVERGSDFTDNIQANALEFTMDCVISNTPTGAIATDATRQGTTPAKDAWDSFVAIHEARQPISVTAPDGTYTNMAMVQLEKVMDAASHGGIVFTAAFKKIVVITNNRTTVRTALVGGGGQNHKGDRQAITLDPSSTWVVSYISDPERRKRATKIFGPPIVKGTDGGNPTQKGKNGQLDTRTVNDDGSISFVTYDRYKVDPLKVTPDGYVDKQGKYTPYKFDPPDGKFHRAPSLFNGPGDNPLNLSRDGIDKPNNFRDYLKNAPKNPPAQQKPSAQPQQPAPGTLASFLQNGS